MKISRRMEWPFQEKLKSFEEVSEYCQLLYQTLTEESALRAIELGVAFTDGYNVVLGHEAGVSLAISLDDTEGIYNVFIGHQAGYSNTTGIKNIAIGYRPLYTNTTGYENIALGSEALYSNTTGYYNVAMGHEAMKNCTIGDQNVALGYKALIASTEGGANVAIGAYALDANTKSRGNTAVGTGALSTFNVTTTALTKNTGCGANTLVTTSTGVQNTALGGDAGYSNETGSGNVFIGYQTGYSETGSNKLYIANSNTATPLIGGVFPNTSLTFTSAASTFVGTLEVYSPTADAIAEIHCHSNDAYLYINSNTDNVGGEESGIHLQDNDVSKWHVYKLMSNAFGIYNYANTENALVIAAADSDATFAGCVADGSCEIMKNEDALAIIDDMLKTGGGKKDKYKHERMDMKKIYSKYPFMIKERTIKEEGKEDKIEYFDKLGAKSDLTYVALGQLVERIEALEAK